MVEKFAVGVVDSGGKSATGVVDTSGALWLANISANFQKYSEAGGKLVHGKNQ
jgi:hypothetical protein